VEGRGLDHGATIALRFLDPHPSTSVVQVSLGPADDPAAHVALGAALHGIDSLVVTSGGAVHNLTTLQRFAPHDVAPPEWATVFQSKLASAVFHEEPDRALLAVMDEHDFELAHPTNEHFLPILVNAGLGGRPTVVYEGWQWSSLGMATYRYAA